jgi:hypothetical protein
VSVAVYIPTPERSAEADYCMKHLEQLIAAGFKAQQTRQQLQVAVLFAEHYAREGASVLRAAGMRSCLDQQMLQWSPTASVNTILGL